MERILVTGGAGFIGSHFVKYILNKYQKYEIINLDALTYAGSVDNLKTIDQDDRYSFVHGDITNAELVNSIFDKRIDYVVNFAAETHVDRSITNPGIFVRTNVCGTQTLLEAALTHGIKKFLQISTDEVYGSIDTGSFTEASPLRPSSPYSASKAGADLLVEAYHTTYALPVLITRCSNNFGPFQYLEKLIPRMIELAHKNELLPVFGDGLNVRDWLYVEDHCTAIDLVLHNGRIGGTYNISAGNELTNVEVVKTILSYLDKPLSLINYVEDRPGHDRRYSVDSAKIRNELGWKPKWEFSEAMKHTIEWYINRFG